MWVRRAGDTAKDSALEQRLSTRRVQTPLESCITHPAYQTFTSQFITVAKYTYEVATK